MPTPVLRNLQSYTHNKISPISNPNFQSKLVTCLFTLNYGVYLRVKNTPTATTPAQFVTSSLVIPQHSEIPGLDQESEQPLILPLTVVEAKCQREAGFSSGGNRPEEIESSTPDKRVYALIARY